MGLDQYFRAKTSVRDYVEPTGICSGMFSICPEDNGMVQIGYLRNAYDQDELIINLLAEDKPLISVEGHLLMSKKVIKKILSEAAYILATHTFDKKDGYDISPDGYFTYDYRGRETYRSDTKWQELIRIMTDAIEILDEDPEAEIYYFTYD